MTDDIYASVRSLVRDDRHQEAVALSANRDTKAVTDAQLHLRWAALLEEMGLMDGAVVELNLAIRDDPHEESAYKRLAEIYLDQGNPEKAARCWAALMARKPPGASEYRELGRIWEEAGNYEKALELYREGEEKTGDDGFKGLIRSLDFVKQEEAEDFAVEKADQIVPAQHNLVTFTVLFASREGVHARQWASPTGETGYTPVHEPLTLKVAENHILGNMTLGVYPVRMDNTVHFIAFDLDLPKFVINKTIKSKSL
ncbi:MAG: tetratricopeptide repeat protein, partial [Pseudomonadota bacterium]